MTLFSQVEHLNTWLNMDCISLFDPRVIIKYVNRWDGYERLKGHIKHSPSHINAPQSIEINLNQHKMFQGV